VTELLVPSLADEVVLLRPWRETDVPAQLEAFNDPFLQRFSDWAPRTEADARAYLAAHEQARQRGEQIEFALVEPHDDDVVLGGGSLNNVDLEQGRAAIGYWLAPHARGRGVATHPCCPAHLLLGIQGPAHRPPGADLRPGQPCVAARCRALRVHT
jgi:RimJ/RimL family protein N-acetyltransferase